MVPHYQQCSDKDCFSSNLHASLCAELLMSDCYTSLRWFIRDGEESVALKWRGTYHEIIKADLLGTHARTSNYSYIISSFFIPMFLYVL